MKTYYKIILWNVFSLFWINGIQAQTSPANFKQIDLMKQFVGTFKCDFANDTSAIWDIKAYGSGLDCNYKFVTNDKIIAEAKQLWGYDKRIDKYILANMTKGENMSIYIIWFKSESNYIEIPFDDIANPEKASWKIEGEFKSPSTIVETTIINNKPVKSETYTRVILTIPPIRLNTAPEGTRTYPVRKDFPPDF